jgi:ketosteroid isomerase-like protein
MYSTIQLHNMKRIFALAFSVFLISCNDKTEEPKETSTATPGTESETKKPLPDFAYPVEMANWTMGDANNTKTVLDVYKAWEQKDSAVFAASFADSASMDMPDARRLTFTKGNAYKRLYNARSKYNAISNQIVSAYALHNVDRNADWVMIMVYNKWTYNSGVKDSALYWDNWRLKDGKIVYLNSLEQAPPKTLLKTLEAELD